DRPAGVRPRAIRRSGSPCSTPLPRAAAVRPGPRWRISVHAWDPGAALPVIRFDQPLSTRGYFAMDPQGRLTALAFRPLSELFLFVWRLERRLEFLYRPCFDRWLRPPLFAMAQKLQNWRREDEGLAIAEERLLPDEEQYIQAIIDELKS